MRAQKSEASAMAAQHELIDVTKRWLLLSDPSLLMLTHADIVHRPPMSHLANCQHATCYYIPFFVLIYVVLLLPST